MLDAGISAFAPWESDSLIGGSTKLLLVDLFVGLITALLGTGILQ